MRKSSNPEVREHIVQQMRDRGVLYTPPPGKIVYPGARHESQGTVVRASDARRLREALSLEAIPLTQFRKALGSLMYHYGQVVRCHIDGMRYFKLLVA